MRGDTYLSQKEPRRAYILEQAVNRRLTVLQAAQLLGPSERQVFRLKGRLKTEEEELAG